MPFLVNLLILMVDRLRSTIFFASPWEKKVFFCICLGYNIVFITYPPISLLPIPVLF